jgi:hypothetical protein
MLINILFAVYLKHSTFWTLAEVKRMWNGEVHAMSCQHILAVSMSMLRTISMARMD